MSDNRTKEMPPWMQPLLTGLDEAERDPEDERNIQKPYRDNIARIRALLLGALGPNGKRPPVTVEGEARKIIDGHQARKKGREAERARRLETGKAKPKPAGLFLEKIRWNVQNQPLPESIDFQLLEQDLLTLEKATPGLRDAWGFDADDVANLRRRITVYGDTPVGEFPIADVMQAIEWFEGPRDPHSPPRDQKTPEMDTVIQ